MQVIGLNGTWRVCQAGKSRGVAARVPGSVHADLLAAGRIPDPFHRANEEDLQWIGEADWVYARTFDVPAELLRHDRVLLRCEGLDTFATIVLNGREVGRADNMYRTWEFDVRSLLIPGANRVEVHFASVLPYMRERESQRRMPGWFGPREPKGRAWVRKEPCNFGWDWGPVLVTCGIWKPISLVAFNTARLTDVQVRQVHADGKVRLDVAAQAERVRSADLSVQVTVFFNDLPVAETRVPCADGVTSAAVTVDNPRLWWPYGMGEQPLYTVTAELVDAEGRALDMVAKRIGLRTLRLDRHPDQWGESFQFAANGVPFFAKGANWIPGDAILARMTPARYAGLLRDARAANMNMLRVWGGGIYEHDVFYDLCDELGICIWQDFMFACSAYPAFDDAFLASVKAEAGDNVRRIRHHPCLALWCGNNELEQGLVGDAWTDGQMSWEDYGRLFDRLLPDVVRALDPDRDYWPCSPHSPVGDRKDFNNPRCGDAHLWAVWHGRQPFEWYRTCEHRFNSEFGFQSFPEPATVRGYTAPEDRNVTTRVMEHHQRSGIGNAVIMQYMLDWFRLPTAFDMTLWLSQIQQGMAIKYAVEHWRRAMPRGMGTLYWQINDCWPVASWASIDSQGRWKALHHMARQFYAPLLVSGLEDAARGTVQVHVTSDRMEAQACEVCWLVTDVAGKRLAGGRRDIIAPPRANTLVETVEAGPLLAKKSARDLLVWLELRTDGATVSRNLVLFARPKHLELRAPGIRTAVRQTGPGAFAVTLTAARPALWTWLETEGLEARYSDNFIHLRPGDPQTVHVSVPPKTTPARFRKALRVRSLIDTYATP